MNSAQDRVVMATTAILESVWIYAALAVAGVYSDQGGSPVSWVAALAVLGLSLVVARTLAMIIMPVWMPYLVQMGAGSLVIYLAIASQVQSGSQGIDLGWISAMSSDATPSGYGFTVGLAGAFGALLWWRGGRLASLVYPVEHLSNIFRRGIIVLAFAAFVDAFHPANLNIFPLMFIFFAAGLVGLSVGHLMPASTRTAGQQAWRRVISTVVGVVVVTGLLFSLLRQGVLTFITTPAVLLLKGGATVFLMVVVVPIGYIVDFLVKRIFSLIARIVGENTTLDWDLPGGFAEALSRAGDEVADTGPSTIIQVIEWTLLAMIVLTVLYFLARSFRRRVRWGRVDQEGMRESLSDEVDPAVDLARLLFNLLPDRFRKRKIKYQLRLPDDESEIVDVFRVYFGMLMLAEDRGSPRPVNQTPSEYQSSLESVFPRSLVRMITAAFNRACYGHQPATRAEIEEMRGALERATVETGG